MPADQRLRDALRLIVGETDDREPSQDRPKTASAAEPQERDRTVDDPEVYPEDWARIGHIDYFYRRNTILVRTADVDRVLEELQRGADPIIPRNVASIERFAVIGGVTGLSWHRLDSDAAVASESEGAVEAKKSEDDHGHGDDGHGDDGHGDDGHGDDGNGDDGNGDDGNGDDGRGGGRHGYHYHGDGPRYSTPYVLARLDNRLGVGVATPDHLLSLCDSGHPCPATEPAIVPTKSASPVPSVSSGICCGTRDWDGAGVLVGIVDNGLIDDAPQMWSWMAEVDGDTEDPIRPTDGLIAHNACHGTFVAGCVRCTAPKADVFVKRVPYPANWQEAGAAYEDEIIRKMSELLDVGMDTDMGTEIIVCEFDGVTRFHLPLKTFDAFYDNRLRQLKNIVILAPAGNNKTSLPTFPAAYSWVIGVGALSADGHRRADFSNHGGWVDVYAPGEDLVNAFAVGDYRCNEDPHTGEVRHFEGLTKWSGTSFSTPLVAGMIAARMSATGESAPRAAEALLRFARSQAIPGVGPVLYPDQVCGTPREPCHAGCDCACGPAVLS
jgi:Subtilase family